MKGMTHDDPEATEILLAIEMCKLDGLNPYEEANTLDASRDEPGVPRVEFRPRWQGYRTAARRQIAIFRFLSR